jgi:hypothetical protein
MKGEQREKSISRAKKDRRGLVRKRRETRARKG